MNAMNLKTIANKTVLLAKKHAPEILTGVGVVSTVTGTVLCCKATLKVDEVLAQHHEVAEKIHDAAENLPEEYSEDDAKKDMAINYVQTAGKLAKMYAPGVLLSVFGIGCMMGSSVVLRKRNVGLMAAYKALDQGWKEYRSRVIEELGIEKDRDFRFGPRKEKVETVTVDAKGKEKTKTEDILVIDQPGAISQYARFFDDSSKEWTKNNEYNLMFLKTQQSIANDKLRANGHIFLNEVYDLLGMKRSQAGAIVGWVYDEDGNGDNYVDFGIYDSFSVQKRDFVNGFENVILLDFNVDGVIYDLI